MATTVSVTVEQASATEITVTISPGVGYLVPLGGTTGQVLTGVTGGAPAWGSVAGTGDVVGPASSMDGRVALFDGVTGKLLKQAAQTIADLLSRANHTGTQLAATISDFTSAALAAVTWSTLTGKPSEFTPSAHGHPISEVTGLQTALDGKSGTGHTHTIFGSSGNGWLEYDSGAQEVVGWATTNECFRLGSDGSWYFGDLPYMINDPTHDDHPVRRGYLNTQLSGKASTSHTHNASDVNAGTLDGDRLPGLSTTKRGGVPATGTPSGKYLKDDGTWAAIPGGGDLLAANNLSDVASAATAFTNIKQAATTSATGVVELATDGENAADKVVQGNDSRLSDARTPTAHAHGNLTNAGAIGSTSGLPIKTGTSGVLEAGAFGTGAGTFCEGNDARLTTDLGYTASTRVLTSSTGADVTLPLADGTNPGLMASADFTKLAGIEAAADVTDAANVADAGAVMESDTSTASMSFVVDEDNMASDSATKVPTQQSVKAYADTKLAKAGSLILQVFCGDHDTAVTTGTNKARFVIPVAFTAASIRFDFVNGANGGSAFVADVNLVGTGTIMATDKLLVDAGESSTATASTAPALTLTSFTAGDILEVDFDSGSGGKGPLLTLIGTPT